MKLHFTKLDGNLFLIQFGGQMNDFFYLWVTVGMTLHPEK